VIRRTLARRADSDAKQQARTVAPAGAGRYSILIGDMATEVALAGIRIVNRF